MALSTLVVDLILKAGGFESDMGRASKTAQKRFKEIERSAKTAAKVIGVAMVGAAALIIKNTIDAANEQAKLAAVLKATGGAAGLTAKEITALADDLQKATTFDAGSIIEMQTKLLTFKSISKDVFADATEAVLDLSTTMGGDLSAASIQLGKALEDPVKGINAMVRSGVSFTNEQKNVIRALVETGRQADAQRMILEAVEGQVGGTARAMRDTLGGSLKSLGHAFNDLLEGETGAGGINGAKDSIESLTDLLQDPDTKRAFAGIIELMAQLAAVATAAAVAISKVFTHKNWERGGPFAANAGDESHLPAWEQSGAFLRAEAKRTGADRVMEFNQPIPSDALRGPSVDTTGLDLRTESEKAKELAKSIRDAAAAERELEQAMAAVRQEREDFSRNVEDMVAQLGGPMAEAQLAHKRELQELQDLYDRGVISVEELTEAQAAYGEIFKRVTDEIRDRQSANDEYLSSLQEELDFLKMTNEERQRAIALRGLDKTATDEQKNAAIALVQAIDAEDKAIRAMDDFRSSLEDTFASIFDGSKSAKEAFSDFAASITASIARIMAQRLVEGLFGEMGTSGGGSAGGFLSSLFGSLFGGGRANGGPVDPSKSYVVGENGAEWFVPNTPGRIVPAGGGVNVTQNINVTGSVDRRTSLQMAADAARMQRLAARNA